MINIFLLTFFLCLILTNITINIFFQRNIKQYILKEAPKTHLAKAGTPTMGGVAILLSILVLILVQQAYLNFNVVICLFLIFGFAGIGLIDDLFKVFKRQNLGLKSGGKLLLQILVATVFVGLLASANHFSSVTGILRNLDPLVYYAFLVFIIVGASNAVNLTDGLDGLAGGTLLIAFVGLFYFSFLDSNYSLQVLIVTILGALFGFLWFNLNPAKIFMGDTGSLALGAGLAGLAIIMHKELALPFLGIVFVAEALSVIIQVTYFKLTHGKRIFKMSPLHHHFELSGWTENKVVLRFWIVGIVALLFTLNFCS